MAAVYNLSKDHNKNFTIRTTLYPIQYLRALQLIRVVLGSHQKTSDLTNDLHKLNFGDSFAFETRPFVVVRLGLNIVQGLRNMVPVSLTHFYYHGSVD